MANLYERIAQCAKEKKISIPSIEKAIGFGNGTIGKWKDSIPAADKLYGVANYLGKSVEYFLTGEEGVSARNNGNVLTNSINESPNATLNIGGNNGLSNQELELIAVYRSLDIRSQADFINYLLNLKK